MAQGYFITGTDTGVGKTYVAVNILRLLQQQGYSTAALKPIATGCQITNEGLRNTDAIALQQAATFKLPYQAINPYPFIDPIAPHIAAKNINCELNVESLLDSCQTVLQSKADYIVVEGVGGWQVPLNDNETLADFAQTLGFPVILVVGLRLGCLNHALLTWENMKRKDINVVGWIANQVDPEMINLEDNINTLQQWLKLPLLASIYYDKMLTKLVFT